MVRYRVPAGARMRSQRIAVFGAAIVGISATSSCAAATPAISVPAGRLAQALTTLGRQAGIDILFSNAVVGDRVTAGVRGRIGAADALSRLLSGSGLTFHRTADGAFVVNRMTDAGAVMPAAEETIPEILVIGRRAQNSDIRRTESDIQPYQVYTRRDIQRAHSDSVDDFARTRLSSNAQIAAPAQLASNTGETRSEIDLRGLGPNQTLVLVDGRRLPNLPQAPFSFDQPDVNGIPVEMIDRIEVLSGTAGGVYGTGAVSGAVNIVLRRDYRGVEVAATTGLTTRGDAFQHRLFGRVGFTPDRGRTEVMLAASTMRNAVLHAGERDYVLRARRRRFANDPVGYLAEFPIGAGVNVYSSTPLTLRAAYGGTALGSTFTTLPLTPGLDLAQRNALLVANAGTTTLDLSPGINGEQASIAAAPSARSIFVNARHDFGGVVAFVDLFDSRNHGRLGSTGQRTSLNPLGPDQPNNPFQQAIILAVPLDPLGFDGDVLIKTRRYTAGLIVPLPGGWRANVEYGGGRARNRTDLTNAFLANGFYPAFALGQPLPGLPPLDPFGDFTQFQAALQAYAVSSSQKSDQSNKFRDANLRVAGNLVDLPGGPATLTLLAEQRREKVEASQFALTLQGSPTGSLLLPRVVQRAESLYGEARLPVAGDGGLLSRLELQLAVRQDWTHITLPGAVTFFETDSPPFTKARDTTLYTAGARFSPLPDVILRASVATGALPPATSQLGSRQFTFTDSTTDPKRGNRRIGTETTLTTISGGSPDLKPERARSLSVGLIASPFGSDGPRLSLDFTRIDKRDEIVTFPANTAARLIALEAQYPDRVTRAPLSDADRALGFSAGPITGLDFRNINLGRTRIDAIDATLDHDFTVDRLGDFQARLRATWEPTLRQRLDDTAPAIERVGYSDGPLEWRVNGSIDWTRGRSTLGASFQLFSRYKPNYAVSPLHEDAFHIRQQGSRYIPGQLYFDVTGIYRFAPIAGSSGPKLRWGVINVFDHRPPTVADSRTPGYSYYGDPRRRRFQVTLELPFAGL